MCVTFWEFHWTLEESSYSPSLGTIATDVFHFSAVCLLLREILLTADDFF